MKMIVSVQAQEARHQLIKKKTQHRMTAAIKTILTLTATATLRSTTLMTTPAAVAATQLSIPL